MITKQAKLSKFAVWSSDAKPLLKLPWKLYYSSGEKMRKHSLHDKEALLLYEIAWNLPPASFLVLLNIKKVCLVPQKRKCGEKPT
jgi:hypothetical protein